MVVRSKTKGNKYQRKIRDFLQRNYVDVLNKEFPVNRYWIEETYGKDTRERPADLIIKMRGKENTWGFDFLFIECKHVKRATRGMKQQWWEHLNRINGVIIYRENRREDRVIFNKYLCETYLDNWISMKLEEGRYGV